MGDDAGQSGGLDDDEQQGTSQYPIKGATVMSYYGSMFEQILNIVFEYVEDSDMLGRVDHDSIVAFAVDEGLAAEIVREMDFSDVADHFDNEDMLGHIMDDDDSFMEIFKLLGEGYRNVMESRDKYRQDFVTQADTVRELNNRVKDLVASNEEMYQTIKNLKAELEEQ